MPGDYYLFGHSTSGKLFWGSTTAKSKTIQVGKATSSGDSDLNFCLNS